MIYLWLIAPGAFVATVAFTVIAGYRWHSAKPRRDTNANQPPKGGNR